VPTENVLAGGGTARFLQKTLGQDPQPKLSQIGFTSRFKWAEGIGIFTLEQANHSISANLAVG